MKPDERIFVAGHTGLVGSAIERRLRRAGYNNLVLRTSTQVDLRDPQATRALFADTRPDYVFLAAAKVGGIHANATRPAEFLLDNLQIQNSVIGAANECGVKKLLFLGSSCIYPKFAPQPLQESSLLTGALEATNEPYAIAKIAGLKLCAAYRRQYGSNFLCVMPTNLYGPHDNYDLDNSHVLPALLRKTHTAMERDDATVTVWGSGTPLREFMHSDDLADACVYLMERYDADDLGEFVNVGTGEEVSIARLAAMITEVVGFRGRVHFDASKPDGTPRKVLDVSRLHRLGWRHRIDLATGLQKVYENFLREHMEMA